MRATHSTHSKYGEVQICAGEPASSKEDYESIAAHHKLKHSYPKYIMTSLCSADESTATSYDIPYMELDTFKDKYMFTYDEATIGSGSYGDVFISKIDNLVIKKVKTLENTLMEINNYSMFYHKLIIRPLGWTLDMHLGVGYIALPYCKDITDIIKDLPMLYKFMYESLCAIEFINRHGFMHLDIKVNNFLYNEAENVFQLIDFGLLQKATLWSDGIRRITHINAYNVNYRDPMFNYYFDNHINIEVFALGKTFYRLFVDLILDSTVPNKNIIVNQLVPNVYTLLRDDSTAQYQIFTRDEADFLYEMLAPTSDIGMAGIAYRNDSTQMLKLFKTTSMYKKSAHPPFYGVFYTPIVPIQPYCSETSPITIKNLMNAFKTTIQKCNTKENIVYSLRLLMRVLPYAVSEIDLHNMASACGILSNLYTNFNSNNYTIAYKIGYMIQPIKKVIKITNGYIISGDDMDKISNVDDIIRLMQDMLSCYYDERFSYTSGVDYTKAKEFLPIDTNETYKILSKTLTEVLNINITYSDSSDKDRFIPHKSSLIIPYNATILSPIVSQKQLIDDIEKLCNPYKSLTYSTSVKIYYLLYQLRKCHTDIQVFSRTIANRIVNRYESLGKKDLKDLLSNFICEYIIPEWMTQYSYRADFLTKERGLSTL